MVHFLEICAKKHLLTSHNYCEIKYSSQRKTKFLHLPNLEICRGMEIVHVQSASKSPGSEIHGLFLNLEKLRGIVQLGLGRLRGIVTLCHLH